MPYTGSGKFYCMMLRIMVRVAAVMLLLVISHWSSMSAEEGQNPAKAQAQDISSTLAEIIKKHQIPGMVAVMIEGGEITGQGHAGLRRADRPDAIALNDQFHLGSNTKAMTATLCGLLVAEGKLRWDQTLAETFPRLQKKMHPQYRDVTLEQLVTNRSGAPGAAFHQMEVWNALWRHKGTSTAGRRLVLEAVTTIKPEAEPGTTFIYSNAGFAIAGHMAETVMNKPWEQLMVERLFTPLGMDSAGFGPPGSPGKLDQPRGHDSQGRPLEPGPQADNPPSIGPAGTVHCSLGDWAKFIVAHLPVGKDRLLSDELQEKLQQPAGTNPSYAMGWNVIARPWADGVVLNHEGSNTFWTAVTWLAPGKDFAVLVATNQANSEACNEAVIACIRLHMSR